MNLFRTRIAISDTKKRNAMIRALLDIGYKPWGEEWADGWRVCFETTTETEQREAQT